MPKVVTYCRVSSDEQAQKDLSIPAQLDCCRAGAQQRGWGVVAELVEAESAALMVTHTPPPDVGGGTKTNEGQNPGLKEVLPRVVNGGGGGSRTRVRSHSTRTSTCVAPDCTSPAPTEAPETGDDYDFIWLFFVPWSARSAPTSGLARS